MLGDAAPEGPDGFLTYADTLPVAEVASTARAAEPASAPTAFGFPASVRRRYEHLDRLPDGLLALGDAVCSFNPVYGQGMSVAALEALALDRHLDSGEGSTAWFDTVARIVDAPWQMSTGGDLAHPGVEGPRTAMVRVANAWLDRVEQAATVAPGATRVVEGTTPGARSGREHRRSSPLMRSGTCVPGPHRPPSATTGGLSRARHSPAGAGRHRRPPPRSAMAGADAVRDARRSVEGLQGHVTPPRARGCGGC